MVYLIRRVLMQSRRYAPRASDSKFCVRAPKVKFRLSAPIFDHPYPAYNRKSTVFKLSAYLLILVEDVVPTFNTITRLDRIF